MIFFYHRFEYFRPWKVVTLLLGVTLLVLGSIYMPSPDWDIPISLVMAGCAYLTAPWSMRCLLERRLRLLPAALFAAWFSIDGNYWLYWHFRDPSVLPLMREANFLASLCLYAICGLVWLYRGSLAELRREVIRVIRD